MESTPRNPQAEQMTHESMLRTLAAQAEAIWPQERELIDRYRLPAALRILDVGCGTGEITRRLAERFPSATLLGVDLVEDHLERARGACRAFGARVCFETGDAFGLELPEGAFDLVVCRHLLQAVPEPALVVAELRRMTAPGGVLHLVAEDYAMMHFHPTTRDLDLFWHQGPFRYAARAGFDLRSGRKMFGELRRLGLEEARVDWIVIDPMHVPREVFARIWTAWRDGYADAIAANTEMAVEEVRACFDEAITAIESPDGYAIWHLPVVSGRAPASP
jgi:SAM-dependent methyltransferase